MRLLARILFAGGAIGALVVCLRKLLDGRAELLRSSAAPEAMLSREELYEKAQGLKIEGRSKMNKRELARAVADQEGRR
jgi:hypothetical protein